MRTPRPRRVLSTITVLGLGTALAQSDAHPRAVSLDSQAGGGFLIPQQFAMLTRPVGKPSAPRHLAITSTLAGSTVAALVDGALVIDPDSGQLVRTDREGTPVARIDIGADASQLAVDRARGLAYVVNRRADQIQVVSLTGTGLRPLREIATPADPYGIALTPDGTKLLVTAIADRVLTAYRAATGEVLWKVPLAPEPRGVAVSRGGDQVAVAFLTTGTMARGALRGDRAPRLEHVALDQVASAQATTFTGAASKQVVAGTMHPDVAASGNPNDRPGESAARAGFTVAFIGHGIAVVPHQVSTPHQAEGSENTGGYGGGVSSPIVHRLAFVAGQAGEPRLAAASLALHQPRAMAYDDRRDRLYLFGYGSDSMTVMGDASQASVHLAFERALSEAGECGPTGAALADDGKVLVFCALSRTLLVVDAPDAQSTVVAVAGELTRSRFSGDELAGRRLFRKGNDLRISKGGAMACESCHPDGRTDGLSWRIESKVLQTPLLAGRIAGTHPFKWDGGDKDIATSLTHTMRRLGGHGLGATEVTQLAAFLESLEPPRAPTATDKKAVARGEKLFRSEATGCASCHGGARMTDQQQHALAHDLEASDTPSLIGLAGSAPYFHDGSAATLEALLSDRGSVHGMGRTARLSKRQVDDLIAYLETL
jgi:mono/diheme cytochrome c family protein